MISYYENKLSEKIIENIRDAVGWKSFTKEQLNIAISRTVYSIVVYENDSPVAMGRLIGDGIYYFICDVAVIPLAQGKGIGTAIVNKLIEFVRDNLHEQERCSIQLIAAQGKEGFYQKIGFSAIPNQHSGHGMQIFISNEI